MMAIILFLRLDLCHNFLLANERVLRPVEFNP